MKVNSQDISEEQVLDRLPNDLLYPAPHDIEEPMHMSYRESYAWQLGWDKGFKAGVESEREKYDTK